jgi:hypothetical protein
MAQYAAGLLETIDRLECEVKHMGVDRIRNQAELQQSRRRISTLNEDIAYKNVMLDVLGEDVDRLEAESKCQKEEIERLTDIMSRDEHARGEYVEFMKEEIIALIDNGKF